jgi:hypothetical protein
VCSTSTANLSVFSSFRVILPATINLSRDKRGRFYVNTRPTVRVAGSASCYTHLRARGQVEKELDLPAALQYNPE